MALAITEIQILKHIDRFKPYQFSKKGLRINIHNFLNLRKKLSSILEIFVNKHKETDNKRPAINFNNLLLLQLKSLLEI